MWALHKCEYAAFFAALVAITPAIKRDPFMAPHFAYYVRELRVLAYAQFLRSYQSVTLQAMADAFGVSVPFLDRELARFILAGRPSCKIDKVVPLALPSPLNR